MRLTALCMCGTLLAFCDLSWTTANSGERAVLWNKAPCVVTLRPAGPCGHGQDEDTCPYRVILPPLTIHLPKQLRELEKIMKEVQKLKDNVDQLRKMCADCAVSQNESESGSLREREHEKLKEGKEQHEDERNWMKERDPERQKENDKDLREELGTDRVKEEKRTTEREGDMELENKKNLEDKGGKKLETGKQRDKVTKKEKEKEKPPKKEEKADGKAQRETEETKESDKLWQAKVHSGGEKEGNAGKVREKVVDKNNNGRKGTVIQKDKDSKGGVKAEREHQLENRKGIERKIEREGNDQHLRQDKNETKREMGKKTQREEDLGSERIKMPEDHGTTDKEKEQHKEGKEKESINERNVEKTKQTERYESTEKENTIRKGEEERETGKEIKTEREKTVQSVQRDSDGELASSKASEMTDIVSPSPTLHSTHSLVPKSDSTDLDETVSFTSPLPSMSSSSSHFITDTRANPVLNTGTDLIPDKPRTTIGSQGTTTTGSGLPTQSPSLSQRTTSITAHLSPSQTTGRWSTTSKMTVRSGLTTQRPDQRPTSPDPETVFRTTSRPTEPPMAGPGLNITSPSTRISSSTTSLRRGASSHSSISSTTATPTTMNVSSKAKPGMKPIPDRRPKPGQKHKPGIKPLPDQVPKYDYDLNPDRAPLPDKKATPDQKPKPSHQKPTVDLKPKPGKKTKTDQIPKPDQRPLPDHLPTHQNPESDQIPNYDQDHSTGQKHIPTQRPKSHQTSMPPPTKKPITIKQNNSDQRPKSDQDPVTDQETKSGEDPIFDQEIKPVHPLETREPDQKLKSGEKPKTDPKTKSDQRSKSNHDSIPVLLEAENSPTSNLRPEPDQKPITEISFDQDPLPDKQPKSVQDSTPGPKLKPDHTHMPPYQKPRPRQKMPKITRPKRPHPDQKSGTEQRPKPDQIPRADPNLGQMPKRDQEHPQFTTGKKTKPDVKPKPDHGPKPDQMPQLNSKSINDQNPEPEPDKQPKPRHPPRHWTPTRPRPRPGATSILKPTPAMKPKPSPTTTTAESSPISGTTSDRIQNSQTEMSMITELNLSQGDTEFRTSMTSPRTSTSSFLEVGLFPRLHTLPTGFTTSLNSRITSDLRPETTSQTTTIPRTTRPKKRTGDTFHPSIISLTSPVSTTPNPPTSPVTNSDSSSQTKIILNLQETTPSQTTKPDKMTILSFGPMPNTGPQTPISILNPSLTSDFGSTTSATSSSEPPTPRPIPDSFTPSAQELRVKINQVAAFQNDSLGPNGRPQDKHLKSQPKEDPGGKATRTESRISTLMSSRDTMARRDCSDHIIKAEKQSGIYLVTPDLRNRTFPVFCDMELHGGGWTLIQRRQDGSVSFNRTWAEYRTGFGELNGGEFWLGNDKIHLLTRARDMILRVELEDFEGVSEYAEYEQFRVASERMRYRLTVGNYSGSAGDALHFSKRYDHNNRAFTTPDRDHDRYPSGNCGAYYSSGWWFDACMAANLNGKYYVGAYKGVRDGIFWGTWHNIATEYYPTNDRQSFKSVKMMIRPKGFAP